MHTPISPSFGPGPKQERGYGRLNTYTRHRPDGRAMLDVMSGGPGEDECLRGSIDFLPRQSRRNRCRRRRVFRLVFRFLRSLSDVLV